MYVCMLCIYLYICVYNIIIYFPIAVQNIVVMAFPLNYYSINDSTVALIFHLPFMNTLNCDFAAGRQYIWYMYAPL